MTTALVRTRHATAHDVPALVALHGRCSPDTLHRRFHVPMSEVPTRLVEQLATPADGWSVVAEQRDDLVGLACAGPVSDAVVEIGLLVEDAHQGAGIGARMTRDVAAEAARRGFSALVCLAQPDNDSVLRTVRRAGLHGVPTRRDGVLEVLAELPARRRGLRRQPRLGRPA